MPIIRNGTDLRYSTFENAVEIIDRDLIKLFKQVPFSNHCDSILEKAV